MCPQRFEYNVKSITFHWFQWTNELCCHLILSSHWFCAFSLPINNWVLKDYFLFSQQIYMDRLHCWSNKETGHVHYSLRARLSPSGAQQHLSWFEKIFPSQFIDQTLLILALQALCFLLCSQNNKTEDAFWHEKKEDR